jgi:hypothetical protein
MTRTITRLFDSHTEALRAIDDLERAGVNQDHISLVSNSTDNWHEGQRHAGSTGGPLGDRGGDRANDVGEDAAKGATTGGLLGGAAGLLAGLGMLAIPGLGPVVAAGWLASTAVGAAAGAAAGGATGGLISALKEAGHSEEEANVYSEGVRRGGTLVSVKAEEDQARRIEDILDQQRGMDARVRGEAYRAQGWTGFDPDAQPYSRDEILAERRRYGETRSFTADEGPQPLSGADDRADRPMSGGASSPTPNP